MHACSLSVYARHKYGVGMHGVTCVKMGNVFTVTAFARIGVG